MINVVHVILNLNSGVFDTIVYIKKWEREKERERKGRKGGREQESLRGKERERRLGAGWRGGRVCDPKPWQPGAGGLGQDGAAERHGCGGDRQIWFAQCPPSQRSNSYTKCPEQASLWSPWVD